MSRAAALVAMGMAATSAGGCLTILGIDEDYSRGSPDAGVAGAGNGGSAAVGGGGGVGAAGGGGPSSTTGSAAGGAGGVGGTPGTGGGNGGSGGAPPLLCPVGMGSAMVDAGGYCIDVTEVTRDHYQTFLAANVPTQATTGLPAYCSFNADYVPSASWPPGAGQLDLPVVSVDWCDALAFCEWAGKRLCGAIGGGPLDQAASSDPVESEWFRACSNAGTTTYTYGSVFGMQCNTPGGGGAEQVGSNLDCHGTMSPYDQVFDLTGNVREWEDSCSAAIGPQDNCNRRGGSFLSGEPTSTCSNLTGGGLVNRGEANDVTGVRCCADP